jgi:hypothetical protein
MVTTGHWSDKYVGEPYIQGVGDCAALAARVAKDEFSIEARIPLSHAVGVRDQAQQIMTTKDEIAVKIESAFDGCPAIFISRGRACHVGVMCWIASDWWVLHADQTAGFVVRQRLRDMTRIKYALEGFYKWI